jgi:signal transduction histidine kinase
LPGPIVARFPIAGDSRAAGGASPTNAGVRVVTCSAAPVTVQRGIAGRRRRMLLVNSPPRVRVEWLGAATRVVLAGGAWIAVFIDPANAPYGGMAAYLLGCYLVFSLCVLALVWAPRRFAHGWGLALHLYDLGAFSVVTTATDGAAGPFFATLTFLLVSAAIRWQLQGTLWTAVAALAVYTMATLLTAPHLLVLDFASRFVYVAVITGLVAYLMTHERRLHRDISRLAAWPRTMSRDPHAVISEVLWQTTELLNAERVVLAWEDADDSRLNLAFAENGEVVWTAEGEGAFGSIVSTAFEARTFQTKDAADDRAQVVVLTAGAFMRRNGCPIDERFRSRFDIGAVQSWRADGDLVRGRIFSLGKTPMSLDELVTGESVARLAASRLDNLYMLRRLRNASALQERMRLARDLHDSLLQSQAGAALQLAAARRLLDRDREASLRRLDDVQRQLEHGELEMRSFIRTLRPPDRDALDGFVHALTERLRELRERIERQWDLKVLFDVDANLDSLPDPLADHVFRLVQEAVINAARHADASMIRAEMAVVDTTVRLTIVDDGKGFPFTGTFDLPALSSAKRGPLTLKERVTELRGDLRLTTSFDAGTELFITVPLAVP